MRKASAVTELFLCSKNLEEIDYSKVPSQCMFKNRKIFQQKDTERYSSFFKSCATGEKKINAATLLPHSIVELYLKKYNDFKGTLEETALETTWNSLVESLRKSPDLKLSNSLAICDVSGSMEGTPMNVAIALSLIVTSLSNQVWNGIICTFSEKPQLHLVAGDSLGEKIQNIQKMDWGTNTNIEAVFDLVYEKTLKEKKSRNVSIDQLFIFSDMRFDLCTSSTKLKSAHHVAKKSLKMLVSSHPKLFIGI